MKRALYISMVCAGLLHASDIKMEAIDIEATVIEDVSGEEVKSADLAEALAKQVPNISLVRRSGIANDIILRGQKKDNINVTVDGGKVCGACPNRMDPPTSHVMSNNVSSIKVVVGQYDV
jgi:iron complex outermembrane receptor protein